MGGYSKMADADFFNVWGDLYLQIQTASLKERQVLLRGVVTFLSNPGVSEETIQHVCTALGLTVSRYRDTTSQYYVRTVIIALAHQHGVWAIKHMSTTLTDIANTYQHLSPTNYTAQSGLYALSWSCVLVMNALETGSEDADKQVQSLTGIQAMLLTTIVAVRNVKKKTKAFKLLSSMWQCTKDSDVLYAYAISKADPSPQVLVFGAYFIKHLLYVNKKYLTDIFKNNMLEIFIKVVINSKTKPAMYIVEELHPFLETVCEGTFRQSLLPTIQRAMLRNPEIIMDSIAEMLSGVAINLSEYAEQIGRNLIANVHSTNEVAREGAVLACLHLAMKCSNSSVLQTLLHQLFEAFTMTPVKTCVLQAAGNLSNNAVNGSGVDRLAAVAVNHFIAVLSTEVHEKTLICALEMLSLWCTKLSTEIVEEIIVLFKNCCGVHTSTPAVRVMFTDCMEACLHAMSSMQAEGLLPVLLDTVNKAVTLPSHAPEVAEVIPAFYLLLKMVSKGILPDSKLSLFWNSLLGSDKQLFLSEKILTITPEKALYHAMQLCELLLVNHRHKLGGNVSTIHRAILFCLTCANSHTRQKCRSLIGPIIATMGPSFVKETMHELHEKLFTKAKKWSPNPKAVVECITSLCVHHENTHDVQLIMMENFMCCHHPAIVAVSPKLWSKLLKRIFENTKNFIEINANFFKKLLIDEYSPTECLESCLRTIVQLNADVILLPLVEFCMASLSDAKILVTEDEYLIYKTPENELYDKNVLSRKFNNGESTKCGAKDMRWKKNAGKLKDLELTSKQNEALRLQLEKEAAIRARLTLLNEKLVKIASMLRTVSAGNPQKMALFLGNLLPYFICAWKSPLAAPFLCELFIEMRKCVFPPQQHSLGQLIAHVSLRLMAPPCILDPGWQEEDLGSAVIRCVSQLHSVSASLSFPAFSYCFPFIQSVLHSVLANNDINVIFKCLEIISVFSLSRKLNDYHQSGVIPLGDMFDLIIEIISQLGGRVQQKAIACLLDIAGLVHHRKCHRDVLYSLLSALQSSMSTVREAALMGLVAVGSIFPSLDDDTVVALELRKRILIARFDVSCENRQLADKLWMAAQLSIPLELCDLLLEDVCHPVQENQISLAQAIAEMLKEKSRLTERVLKKLLSIYEERLNIVPAILDSMGRVLEPPIDVWQPRSCVALVLVHIVPLLSARAATVLVTFFMTQGLADRKEEVRKNMLEAALQIVEQHGKQAVSMLFPLFEEFLDNAPDTGVNNPVCQSIVILMGSLVRHLDMTDPKIHTVVTKLIDALSTPSQQVQEAIARCLPPLVPAVKDETGLLIDKLLNQLLESDVYGKRKGAAYGLAGMVKGMGIASLKDIMTTLTHAIQDKKDYRHREGALFALEMLCSMLGRLFEPYVVQILPHLLLCFGDCNQCVRNATYDTAHVIMSKLSAYGLKLVLPSLLAALEEDSWRTKTGSVKLLGAMAYCAPKQLTSCLPSIVPKLIELLGDSHMKVQKSAAQSLKLISSVIQNPEIQEIAPVLLQALQDPITHISSCLQSLMNTHFEHCIDAPSLALIIPVIHRAFIDRSMETRKIAAQIISCIYSLTDTKDLAPYVRTILPGLKVSLLDPDPDTRSVSAQALGAIVRGLPESSFDDLLPWLMQTLTSDTSPVDRSGAAQGLSAVVKGLGVEKLHKIMPEIISTAERMDIAPHVKDGYIMMFIYMPMEFSNEFIPYIATVLKPILTALADGNEYVRETALKAGQQMVNLYAKTAIKLLLPELERGLFDDNWRVRNSSIMLLGDLLYRISGVSCKMSTDTVENDEHFGTQQSHCAIIAALGEESRNHVLAGLYMGMSDMALMVRQTALDVWKVVVTNTSRTLHEILPTLLSLLLSCFGSTSYDKKQGATKAFQGLLRKLGERVVPEIMPLLTKSIQSEVPDHRQGVCIALSEIIMFVSRDFLFNLVEDTTAILQMALCDILPQVRHTAAKTFHNLPSSLILHILDDLFCYLFNQLEDPDPSITDATVNGLCQVLSVKSSVILPYILPKLVTSNTINTKALSVLAAASGETFSPYLNMVLTPMLDNLATVDISIAEQEFEYCRSMVLTPMDSRGVTTVLNELIHKMEADTPQVQKVSVRLMHAFCQNTNANYSQFAPLLLHRLILTLNETDVEILHMTLETISAVIKHVPSSELICHIGVVQNSFQSVARNLKDVEYLPGLCTLQGINPFLPILRETLVKGTSTQKAQAALCIRDLVCLMDPKMLTESALLITGPLIRILGERNICDVTTPVLEVLSLLLDRVGDTLQGFLPPLKSAFLKMLDDRNRNVRLKAAAAIANLCKTHIRIDSLLKEFHPQIYTSGSPTVRETTLVALRGVISHAGDKISEQVCSDLYSQLTCMLGTTDSTIRIVAAGCLGALCRWLPTTLQDNILSQHLLNDSANVDWITIHGRGIALMVALKESPTFVYTKKYEDPVQRALQTYMMSDKVPVVTNGIRGCGYLLCHLMLTSQQLPQHVIHWLAKGMQHSSNEVKQLMAQVCLFFAKKIPQIPLELIQVSIPALAKGVRDRNNEVRGESEKAIVALLQLKFGESDLQQRCLNLFEIDDINAMIQNVQHLQNMYKDLDHTLLE